MEGSVRDCGIHVGALRFVFSGGGGWRVVDDTTRSVAAAVRTTLLDVVEASSDALRLVDGMLKVVSVCS